MPVRGYSRPPFSDLPSLSYLDPGRLTILAGAIFLLVCPNSPTDARFLSPDERVIALERVRCNQSSLESKIM